MGLRQTIRRVLFKGRDPLRDLEELEQELTALKASSDALVKLYEYRIDQIYQRITDLLSAEVQYSNLIERTDSQQVSDHRNHPVIRVPSDKADVDETAK